MNVYDEAMSEEKSNAHRGVIQQLNRSVTGSAPRRAIPQVVEEVDGYEVQPDRVVYYLWPSAGGSKFQFIFHPRFGITAMSAPSVLYDYYNPEANATVLPLRFNVQ